LSPLLSCSPLSSVLFLLLSPLASLPLLSCSSPLCLSCSLSLLCVCLLCCTAPLLCVCPAPFLLLLLFLCCPAPLLCPAPSLLCVCLLCCTAPLLCVCPAPFLLLLLFLCVYLLSVLSCSAGLRVLSSLLLLLSPPCVVLQVQGSDRFKSWREKDHSFWNKIAQGSLLSSIVLLRLVLITELSPTEGIQCAERSHRTRTQRFTELKGHCQKSMTPCFHRSSIVLLGFQERHFSENPGSDHTRLKDH
jgi:hypothetical protein